MTAIPFLHSSVWKDSFIRYAAQARFALVSNDVANDFLSDPYVRKNLDTKAKCGSTDLACLFIFFGELCGIPVYGSWRNMIVGMEPRTLLFSDLHSGVSVPIP